MNKKKYEELWDEALEQICKDYKQKKREEEFNIWFRMKYLEEDLNSIKIAVPSEFMLVTVMKKGFLKEIELKIEELCGQKIKILCVIETQKNTFIDDIKKEKNNENDKGHYVFISKDNNNLEKNISKRRFRNFEEKIFPQLKPDFTFENFVCGENNEYAYSASLAVAKQPGKKYNPLFIYGGVGLGKTHLMQAIGNYILNNTSIEKNVKICYITAENFLNEMVFSIRDNSSEKFQQKYRTLDILLLDDIHFLQNKTATQEEVFFTFESLSRIHSQIVFTCDRPPSELNGISERLKSRFTSNLIIDLQPPDYETRKAILLKKIEIKQKEISEEVVDFIAKSVCSNVRDLEACLDNVIAYSELLKKKLTVEIVKKYLIVKTKVSSEEVSINLIQQVVADYYNISLNEIRGIKRNKRIAFPRHIAIYISRILTESSFNEIASEFGGKDHSTIMHSFDKIESLLKVDENLKNIVELLINKVKNSTIK